MKLKRKYKRGELACMVLKGLALGGFIVAVVALPGLAQIYKLFGTKTAKDRYRIRQSLEGLARKKFIRVYSKNGKEVVEITQKGRRKILAFTLAEMKIKKPSRWDGKWHIVAFDIPERKKRAREAFRLKLNDLGFYRLQNSVFAHPYPCEGEITFLKEYHFLGKEVLYLNTDELGEHTPIVTKHFGLKVT